MGAMGLGFVGGGENRLDLVGGGVDHAGARDLRRRGVVARVHGDDAPLAGLLER